MVERDRRLVVIDTTTGQTAQRDRSPIDPGADPPRRWLPSQTRFDGTAELTTHPWYDDRGPRTLRLAPDGVLTLGRLKLVAAVIAFMLIVFALTSPWLLLPLAFVIGNAAVRRHLRAGVTRWLDRIADAGG